MQACPLADIRQFACQMVKVRERIQKADELASRYPDDEGVADMRAKIDIGIEKYRRMAESYLRGGAKEHIADMT